MAERTDTVIAWTKRFIGKHPILGSLLAVYLALSAAELVRTLLFHRPRVSDVGLHFWERGDDAGRMRRFRWTVGEDAYLLRPVAGAVLTVRTTLHRPDMPGPVIPVELFLAQQALGHTAFLVNGWDAQTHFIPPLLGPERWESVQRGWKELFPYAGRDPELTRYRAAWYEDLGPSPRRTALINLLWEEEQVPDYQRLFTAWHVPPGPPSVWLRVRVPEAATFVPAEVTGSDDTRELGVGLGELAWSDDLPAEGLGFHPWETDPAGRRFRWTRQRASVPVDLSGSGPPRYRLRFGLTAGHPDLEENPVRIEFFWGAEQVHAVTLGEDGWKPVEVVVRPHDPGSAVARHFQGGARLDVLSLFVSRVWNPLLWSRRHADNQGAEVQDPTDPRFLGVAMTEIEVLPVRPRKR